jgi:uncharacterized membrane protein YebE (DUF533 family)
MIDFTTIQANPIPPSIFELQRANSSLKMENETLKTAIIIGVGVLAIYVAYQIYNKYKEDEAKKHQHTRD